MEEAENLKRDLRKVLTHYHLRTQLMMAAQVMDEMLADIKRQGYTWSPERGCYEHPDGSVFRIED